MVEALFFWALALYGAVILAWQCTRWLNRRRQRPHPLTVILVVQNAAQQIEGVIRTLMLETAWSARERKIFVIDYGSTDETANILQHLAKVHTCLEFVTVLTEAEFQQHLQSACLSEAHIGCIYDLRVSGVSQDVTADLAALCRHA
ncbi:hypothetical protein JI721_08395 [Alicyclobacillus cycloheptanicus]|uniref:Glycosyl transferase family 2 n=1 Tax=Alicyclobacillus cycloheptanicus TaxID=1457 RepID=A0ABT9XLK2_9BACL|nr:hypothetical protein [Alicyclobacillus cycloheptanicus]MDQ0191102.1 hypothetical protein [Alicyclobacillus cycloheptanicus]WDM02759.1 hypothetical protein JI721_08395 [Alicyclobacillus cycloheptanicus]